MKIRKILMFAAVLSVSALLGGCSGVYDYEEPTRPDNSDLVTAETGEKNLKKVDTPKVVAKYKGDDPTLIEGSYFLSTNGFRAAKILVANNYFTYEPLANGTFDELNALTEPTNVHVTLYRDAARTDWSKRFSCFIYKIDEDYIYLGTAGHCTYDKSTLKYANLMFYDRKVIKLAMQDYKLGGEFLSNAGDYAMYRIPIEVIPESTLMNLRQACFSLDHVNAVKAGDTLFTGNIYAKNSKTDYDFESKVLTKDADATVTYYMENYPALKKDIYFITNRAAVSGQSGSGIFDKQGYVVACVSGEFHQSSSNTYGIFTALTKMDNLYREYKAEEAAE